MLEILNDPRVSREVTRISLKGEKENPEMNNGRIASYLLKCLILEDKEVFVKYISEGKNAPELALKVQKILTIMGRMLDDPIETICGGPANVPDKYRNVKLKVVLDLPYIRNTIMSKVRKVNDVYVKTQTEEDKETAKRATIIKLRLAVER